MNTSFKCNCCCKENVCKYKANYEADCTKIQSVIIGETTEVAIKCKEFMANQPTIRQFKGE